MFIQSALYKSGHIKVILKVGLHKKPVKTKKKVLLLIN